MKQGRSLAIAAAVVAIAVIVVNLRSGHGPRLRPWHILAPSSELDADEIDGDLDFAGYRELESRVFAEFATMLAEEVEPTPELATSRYLLGGRNDPATFATNWNRSFEIVPDGARGAAVLVHGLTDSPYSLRALGEAVADRGMAVVGLRLPGHGTVPEALDRVEREDWAVAVRLAMKHAHGLCRGGPLVLIGYSNGAALALEYAMDAVDDRRLPGPDRLVMLSPAVGVTRFAVLAGLPRLRRFVPLVGRLRWTEIVPEIDPYKYGSFAANGGYLTHRLTVSNRRRLARLAAEGRAGELPPVLAFVSLADATVQVEAVAADLFEPLADPASELVVFDVNRFAAIAGFLQFDPAERLAWLADRAPLQWRLTVITNAGTDTLEVVERRWEPGTTEVVSEVLGLAWPPEVFSLSHVAVPFPPDDPLYGYAALAVDWGLPLGRLEPRGEKGLLSLSLDSLMRLRCNPFYPYLERRVVEAVIGEGAAVEVGETVPGPP